VQEPHQSRAFRGTDQSATRWFAEQPGWWAGHYVDAVDQLVAFLHGDGLTLEGRTVLDVGCGDGIISLGLAQRTGAAKVLGLDLQPVDLQFLEREAKANDVDPASPKLEFQLSDPASLPVADESAQAIVTWSVFEHVADVAGLLGEFHRVLDASGLLYIQVWPLFHSEHGSHLWPWFSQPFPHLLLSEADIRSQVERQTGDVGLANAMLDLYESCNKITLDQLGESLVDAGFFISKVEVMTNAFHVPPELQRTPLSLLATGGVHLLATRL
jgi:ubiquinone/menaquinone biosynthesis C-methylase UbiE